MTEKQKTLLEFLRSYSTESEGRMPSYDEMMAHLGLRSKSGVHRLIVALERGGHIVRRPNCARAIRLTEGLSDGRVGVMSMAQIEGVCRDGIKGYIPAVQALRRISEIIKFNMGGV